MFESSDITLFVCIWVCGGSIDRSRFVEMIIDNQALKTPKVGPEIRSDNAWGKEIIFYYLLGQLVTGGKTSYISGGPDFAAWTIGEPLNVCLL